MEIFCISISLFEPHHFLSLLPIHLMSERCTDSLFKDKILVVLVGEEGSWWTLSKESSTPHIRDGIQGIDRLLQSANWLRQC